MLVTFGQLFSVDRQTVLSRVSLRRRPGFTDLSLVDRAPTFDASPAISHGSANYHLSFVYFFASFSITDSCFVAVKLKLNDTVLASEIQGVTCLMASHSV